MLSFILLMASLLPQTSSLARDLSEPFNVPICRADHGAYRVEYIVIGSHQQLTQEGGFFHILERVVLPDHSQTFYQHMGSGVATSYAVANGDLHVLNGTFKSSFSLEPVEISIDHNVTLDHDEFYIVRIGKTELSCDSID